MNEVINIEITKKEYPPAGEALNQGGDKGTNNFAQKQEKCAENFDFENPFPLDALPAQMKRDCEELHRCWPAFVPDFQAGAILYAASVVVGNTYRVMSPSGWSTSAALYSAIVGRSGSGKSPVLEYWTKPLEVIDGEKYKLYCDDLAVFNAEVKSGNLSATKPALVNVLLKDATNEALMQALNDAPRGCGLLCEELASWVQNFNRYHKGSDKQAFLSIWSGQNVKVSRKTDGTLLIEKPHLSVIGGVQNELIKSLFDARDGSGFRERLLFFMPRFLKIEYETDAVPDPSIATRWAATIRRLYDVAFDGEPKILSLSAEAREFYRLWNIRFTDERNEPQNYRYGAIFSKMSEYGLRLSLVLECLDAALNNRVPTEISAQSFVNALKITEYCKQCAMDVYDEISTDNETVGMDKLHRAVYDALPDDEFNRSDGKDIALKHGMPVRSFDRFLTDSRFFEKLKRGFFQKILVGNLATTATTAKVATTFLPQLPQLPVATQKFSFFRRPITNRVPTKTATLKNIYAAITGDFYKKVTAELRAIPTDDKETRRQFKSGKLDFCTFSALMADGRDEKHVKERTGLICLDFDHLPAVQETKRILLADKELDVALMFISPSGDGLKVVVPIDLNHTHKDNFDAISNYLSTTYGLITDKSGSDVARACYLCHDADAFINPQILPDDSN